VTDSEGVSAIVIDVSVYRTVVLPTADSFFKHLKDSHVFSAADIQDIVSVDVWNESSLLLCGKNVCGNHARSEVLRLIDLFVADYTAANPTNVSDH